MIIRYDSRTERMIVRPCGMIVGPCGLIVGPSGMIVGPGSCLEHCQGEFLLVSRFLGTRPAAASRPG